MKNFIYRILQRIPGNITYECPSGLVQTQYEEGVAYMIASGDIFVTADGGQLAASPSASGRPLLLP